MSEIDYEKLDPGIRATVRLLNINGFATSDSGDGATNVMAGVSPLDSGVIPWPHIVVPCHPSFMAETAQAIAELLRAEGLAPAAQPVTLAELGPCGVVVTTSFCVGESTAIVLVEHLDDDKLALAHVAAKGGMS